MSEELTDCPFCGAEMEPLNLNDFIHPGTVTDGECLLSGQGFYGDQRAAWNARIPPSQHREPIEADREADTLESQAIFAETVDNGGWSLTLHFGKGDDARDQMRRWSDYLRGHRLAFSTPAASDGEALPADVVTLVIAAREAWEFLQEHYPSDSVTGVLDKAVEQFASRVPYENEPDDARALPLPKAGKGDERGPDEEPSRP